MEYKVSLFKNDSRTIYGSSACKTALLNFNGRSLSFLGIHSSSVSKTAIPGSDGSSLSFFKKYANIVINPYLFNSLKASERKSLLS